MNLVVKGSRERNVQSLTCNEAHIPRHLKRLDTTPTENRASKLGVYEDGFHQVLPIRIWVASEDICELLKNRKYSPPECHHFVELPIRVYARKRNLKLSAPFFNIRNSE